MYNFLFASSGDETFKKRSTHKEKKDYPLKRKVTAFKVDPY